MNKDDKIHKLNLQLDAKDHLIRNQGYKLLKWASMCDARDTTIRELRRVRNEERRAIKSFDRKRITTEVLEGRGGSVKDEPRDISERSKGIDPEPWFLPT